MRLLRIDVLFTTVTFSVGNKLMAEIAGESGAWRRRRPRSARLAAAAELARARCQFVQDEIAAAADVRHPRVHSPQLAAREEISEPAGIRSVDRLAAGELLQLP